MYFYTCEEENWLKENASNYINSFTLTDAFNSRFKSNRTAPAIRKKLNSLGYKFGHSGGHRKGYGFSTTAAPVGAECWKGGYLYVKVADNPLPKNFTTEDIRKNWKQKHRLVWEKAYGKIPKGGIIVFLDGDRNNFDLDNLYCTSKKITTPMIRNNWFSDNREMTLTAIKWCELFYAMKTQ
ncbi:MAG: HNH endonuclease [Limnochordia bacterium]|jgi:hypothetical protein|nr:HNH endonuclease [Limnochordia bacterium]